MPATPLRRRHFARLRRLVAAGIAAAVVANVVVGIAAVHAIDAHPATHPLAMRPHVSVASEGTPPYGPTTKATPGRPAPSAATVSASVPKALRARSPTVPSAAASTPISGTPTWVSTHVLPLAWPPPQLSNPVDVYVSNAYHTLSLDSTRDYRVHMPSGYLSVQGGLTITGGHNVVLIGGAITIPGPWPACCHDVRDRAVYLEGQTGVAHLEGLLIDNSGGALSEGIDINAPRAVVQLENIRIVGIRAQDEMGFTDNHPDLVQPWGGALALRIDGLWGSTDYQGLTLKADFNSLGPVDVRNVEVVSTPAPSWLHTRDLLWLTGGTSATHVTLTNVWIDPGAVPYRPDQEVWPNSDAGSGNGARFRQGSISWPTSQTIVGSVTLGRPSGAEIVPAGLVGRGYPAAGYH